MSSQSDNEAISQKAPTESPIHELTAHLIVFIGVACLSDTMCVNRTAQIRFFP